MTFSFYGITNSAMNLQTASLAQLKEIVSIKEEIASLEAKLAKILGGKTQPIILPATPAKKGRRKMSASAKAKIAAAAKARWAKIKGTGPVVVKAAPVSKTAPAAKPARKAKRVLSPEGRARIVAALKKRWAKKK